MESISWMALGISWIPPGISLTSADLCEKQQPELMRICFWLFLESREMSRIKVQMSQVWRENTKILKEKVRDSTEYS